MKLRSIISIWDTFPKVYLSCCSLQLETETQLICLRYSSKLPVQSVLAPQSWERGCHGTPVRLRVPSHSGNGNVFTASTHIQTLDLSRTPLNMHVRRPEGGRHGFLYTSQTFEQREKFCQMVLILPHFIRQIWSSNQCCSVFVSKYDYA